MSDVSEHARRRAMRVLFGGVALGTTSFVVSITVSPLAAREITSVTSLTGLPWTAGVLGTGVGSFLLSRAMVARGRRYGLVAGYAIGALGAGIALAAFLWRSLPLLIAGTLVFGFGNAANHLARYAASDLYPPERRGAALGTIAWAGTVGGVAGPSLLGPSAGVANALGQRDLAGPFILTLAGFAIGAAGFVALLRISAPGPDEGPLELHRPFAMPRIQIALVSLAAAQIVMVMIMSMTPVHIRDMGHGLGTVGIVISAHVFGMYGLSPVSGRLVDRFGSIAMIGTGFALLIASAAAAAAVPAHPGWVLAGPLFLLGLGWNCAYVAGSALLTSGLSYAERTKLQGTTDAVVWTSAAVSSAASGAILAGTGYVGLCAVAAALVAVPVIIVTARRRSLDPTGAAA